MRLVQNTRGVYCSYDADKADKILHHVANSYGKTIDAFLLPERTQELSLMRFTATKLLKLYQPNISLSQIATLMGRKNHSTIHKNLLKIDDFIAQEDPLFYPTYQKCHSSLNITLKNTSLI